MSNYTKTTNFAAKTSASDVVGNELNVEFNAIAVAIATKQDTTITTFAWQGNQPSLIVGGYGESVHSLGSLANGGTVTPNFALGSFNTVSVTGAVGVGEVFTFANPTGATPGSGPFTLYITSDNLVSEDTWSRGTKLYFSSDTGFGGLGPNDIAFVDVVYHASLGASGLYLLEQYTSTNWTAA